MPQAHSHPCQGLRQLAGLQLPSLQLDGLQLPSLHLDGLQLLSLQLDALVAAASANPPAASRLSRPRQLQQINSTHLQTILEW
jgi:hypothetical protein